MAIACLRDLTLGPRSDPLCSVPRLYSPITFLILAWPRVGFAMVSSVCDPLSLLPRVELHRRRRRRRHPPFAFVGVVLAQLGEHLVEAVEALHVGVNLPAQVRIQFDAVAMQSFAHAFEVDHFLFHVVSSY